MNSCLCVYLCGQVLTVCSHTCTGIFKMAYSSFLFNSKILNESGNITFDSVILYSTDLFEVGSTGVKKRKPLNEHEREKAHEG